MKNKKNIKQYYIFLFLPLFLVILVMFYFVYNKHRNTVEEQQKNQLALLATTAANYVHSYLDEKQYEFQNILEIPRLKNTPEDIEQQVVEKIKLYWSIGLTYLDYLKYYPIKDLPTTTITSLSADSLEYYTDLAMSSNEVIIGPWVSINSDHNGIYIFKGIFDENGKHGLVVGRVDMKMAFKKTIGQMSVGENGYFTLGDINNNKLLRGDSPFFRQRKHQAKVLKEDEAILSGYSYITFGSHNILITAKLPYFEINQPIKQTFYFLLGLSIGLLALFIFLTMTLLRMNRAKIEHSLMMQYQEEIHSLNKNATLGIFSREIAHEYNNLLTPIQIYCELLEGELSDNEELSDYLNEITQAVHQCKTVANQLLNFGRNQTTSSSNAKFDSVEVIRGHIKRLHSSLPNSIQLVSKLPDTTVFLCGERLQLVQLLFNLCINSIHAMEQSGGTLTISYSTEGEEAILNISDTGSGMSEETKKHLFKSGFTTKKEGMGNGLGLAIVCKIVDQFDGKITFTSTQNIGTTFTIRFPICE